MTTDYIKLADEAAAISKGISLTRHEMRSLITRLEQAVRELVAQCDAAIANQAIERARADEARASLEACDAVSKDYLAIAQRFERERDEARAEVALARERLGPAGWKMLEELQEKRAEVESLRNALAMKESLVESWRNKCLEARNQMLGAIT